MKTRRCAYTLTILIAALLSLAPAILWMDFVAPYSAYEVWQRRENELVFRLSESAGATGELDSEIAVFEALVAPTLIPTWFGVPRPEYTRFAFPDNTIVELAGVQPSRLAIEYVAVAAPTWALLLALCYELLRWVFRARDGGLTSR
jgi:hypothetical protein